MALNSKNINSSMNEGNEPTLEDIIKDIESQKSDLKEIFDKRTKNKKKVKISETGDILDDFSVQLSIDCEGAKKFFSENNSQIPQHIDLEKINFEQFLEIFILWMRVDMFEDSRMNDDLLDKSVRFAEEHIKANYLTSKQRLNIMRTKISEKITEHFMDRVIPEEPMDLSEIMNKKPGNKEPDGKKSSKKNKKQIQEDEEEQEEEKEAEDAEDQSKEEEDNEGDDREKEEGQAEGENSNADEGNNSDSSKKAKKKKKKEKSKKKPKTPEPLISTQDCLIFLRECFYEPEAGFVLVELRDDVTEFFSKENSFKRFFSVIENYFIQEKKVNKGKAFVKMAKVTQGEAFDILDFWMRNDESVWILDEGEFQDNIQKKIEENNRKVERSIADTIEKYENLLNECQNEDEKAVLLNSIVTLRKQLEKIRRSNDQRTTPGQSFIASSIGGKKIMTAEKRKKFLKEIFDHYCKQVYVTGRHTSFERVEKESNVITMGAFVQFCAHFNLFYRENDIERIKKNEAPKERIKRDRLIQLYKKCSGNNKELEFDEFLSLLKILANYVYDNGEFRDINEIHKQYEEEDKKKFVEIKKKKREWKKKLDEFRKKREERKKRKEDRLAAEKEGRPYNPKKPVNEDEEEGEREEGDENKENKPEGEEEEEQNVDDDKKKKANPAKKKPAKKRQEESNEEGENQEEENEANENEDEQNEGDREKNEIVETEEEKRRRLEEEERKKIEDDRKKEEKNLEALYNYMGLDINQSYRNKVQYIHLAFNSADPENFRYPDSQYRPKIKPLPGKLVEDLKEEMKKRRELKSKDLKEKMDEQSKLQNFKKNYLERYKQLATDPNSGKSELYQQIQVKNSVGKGDGKSKISWEKLGAISYADFKGFQDDGFKPTDLFDENDDDEDQFYLAEYNLHHEKLAKNQANQEMKKSIEEYGKLKKELRPTQKYLQQREYSTNIQTSPNEKLIKASLDLQRKGGLGAAPGGRQHSQSPPNRNDDGAKKKTKASNLSHQYLERAHQVDIEAKKKEKQMMKQINQMHENQLKKGLKAAKGKAY